MSAARSRGQRSGLLSVHADLVRPVHSDRDAGRFAGKSAGAAADAVWPRPSTAGIGGRGVRQRGIASAAFAGGNVLRDRFVVGLGQRRRGGRRRLQFGDFIHFRQRPIRQRRIGADSLAIARPDANSDLLLDSHSDPMIDLNGDGIPDLVVANQFSSNISVMFGVGDGTFRPAVNYAADCLPRPWQSAISITMAMKTSPWRIISLATCRSC